MTQNHSEEVFTALRDELAAVTPSPEFADRVRQRIAGELPLLREELAAVEPSPAFKARVRQQIEADAVSRARSRWLDWRWLVPIGVAAAAVVAILFATRPKVQVPAPTVQTAQATDRPGPIQATTPVGVAPAARRVVAGGVQTPVSVAPTVVSSELSLEVMTNQPAILRAIWRRANQAEAAQLATTATPLPENAPEITVLPIEVSPVVVKPLVETPEGGASPIIRKN
jgi:hypothetical protein